MGRYSPTVRPDPGGPLDFSPLSSALRQLQDNRLRRRQQKLWEDREAEDRRVQGERERVAAEERANDVRRRGGQPLLSAPIGQPTIRDMTPSRETRVPSAVGGGSLRPLLPASSGGDAREDGTGRYTETIDGETYLVDPLQPMRLQDRVRRDTERAKLTANGRVSRTFLSGVPQFKDALATLSDEDLGRMPLSEVDALARVGTPKPLSAREDVTGQAKAYGIDVTGMSPGEAATRVAMAERKWETANRPASADDESKALLREERRARAKAAFARRQVLAGQGLGLDNDAKFFGDKRIWNSQTLAEAKRLGMTNADYIAARQEYRDKPSTESARAERGKANASALDRLLAEEGVTAKAGGANEQGGGDYSEDDYVRALQALGPKATEAQARAWLDKQGRR